MGISYERGAPVCPTEAPFGLTRGPHGMRVFHAQAPVVCPTKGPFGLALSDSPLVAALGRVALD